jgi:PAS domain S-box-containing protein
MHTSSSHLATLLVREAMSHLPFASLRARLLLLVLLAVVPILGLTSYTNLELRRLAAADAKAEALQLARLAASDQQDTMKDTRQLLFALAQFPELARIDPAACSAFFARLLNQYPQYALLGVIAPDGDLFCSALPTAGSVNLAGHDFFQHALQTRDFAIGSYRNDSVSDKATLNLGYPVLDEAGEVQAVVFAALDLTWLNELAAEAQLPEGSTFTAIDRNGTILVRYPDPGIWVGQSVPEAPIVETILSEQGEGTAEAYGVDGIARLFAFTPLSGTPATGDVYVSIGIPSSVAFADTNRLMARNLAALGLVTVLALAAAWVSGNLFILRRVNVLVSATRRLSTGDLSARTGLPYGYGELSHLARSFDDMARSLERRVAERDQAEEALRESQRTLSTLMSNLPGIAYRCQNDWDRTMEFVSQGCLELIGYSPSDLIGHQKVSYAQLIHPEDRKPMWDEVQAALEQGVPFQLTYRVRTVSGEEKWVWEQGRGVVSAEGTLLALEGFISDITERVLTHQILEHRVADRTRELSALYDVTAVASSSLDLEMVLDRSLDRVLAVMETDLGTVHLLDETEGMLNLVASRGIPPGDAAQVVSVPVGNGLVGWVVEQGKPLVVSNITTGPRPLLAIPNGDSRAYLGVPIQTRGRVSGVLSVVGEVMQQFNAEEVALLDTIADQIGVAVDNARLYQQAEQLAVMKERSRLARELHDSVTQALYSMTLLAEAAGRQVGAGNLERVENYLARLGEAAQQSLKEMRLLVHELRPPVLGREGLVGALQQRLDAVEGRSGVETRLRMEGTLELPALVEEELYRIAQEALNNALKHAAATRVTIHIRANDQGVELEVADNGIGFNPEAVSDKGGVGLVSMRERAERLDGLLTIFSASGEGTRVRITVQMDGNVPPISRSLLCSLDTSEVSQ